MENIESGVLKLLVKSDEQMGKGILYAGVCRKAVDASLSLWMQTCLTNCKQSTIS